ncbi:type I polyketide synthase [Kitasatospora sp. NPDC101183]|uniref:type I polyketide synthase n=1 Tax=Kitasatospora sp. NPDC101183 TaxID=3364100 RepID=UPI00381A7BED
MDQSEVASDRSIAVIGLGCRFPGASNADEFWEHLVGNADSVTAIPGDRYDAAAYHSPDPATPGKSVSARGGFIADPFAFDPGFFGISPAEARAIDPQHRVLLQVVWEALEDAGIRPSALAGSRTGVFIGQATAEYGDEHRQLAEQDIRRTIGSQLRAMASGRVSYALDLRGPSLSLDTACSSSLVAVHTARQSLLTGESDLAVAGGVNVVLSPRDSIAYSQAGMLSPEGRCAFGDADASGFVRSDGVGVVLLKRLADARRDGDRVLAVIAGSAVNNDGRGSGLLVKPSVPGQTEMLREACRSAGITPADLGYVEAHGTGTAVGDAVELSALAAALGPERGPDRPLPTGSVKSNIGHAEAAAGMAGLIKTVLIAHHGLIPASLHLATPHPLLADPAFPVRVVTANEPLDDRHGAYLGVSSFGLSGTNAHVVVRCCSPEPATARAEAADGRPALLVIGARSQHSLERLATAWARYLRPGGAGHREPLRELCAAAALRRDHHPYRIWVIGRDHEEVADRLEALAAGEEIADGGLGEAGFGAPRQTVFVFPGQGAQWPGMGRRLLDAFPAFRARMAECDAAISAELGWSVVELLRSQQAEFPTAIDIVQPALWAMEVSLAALWQDLGVAPSACVGHSMGETAAAVVAGALSLGDAAAVICRRSRLMRQLGGRGRMLATDLSPDEAEAAAARHPEALCVAVENSPHSTVLAGDGDLLAGLAERLAERGRLARFVKVAVASHSPDMDPLRPELLTALADIEPRGAALPLFSTVRAEAVPGAALDAGYWMDNLRRPVRFATAVALVAKQEESVFLEVGPHPLLTSAVEETMEALGAPYPAVASLRRTEDEAVELARAAGRLHAAGAAVDFSRWFGASARPLPLPRYPWDDEHLREAPAAASTATGYTYERPLDIEALGVSYRGTAVVPPMLYVDAVLGAARSELGGRHRLEDVVLTGELVDRRQACGASLRVRLRPEGSDHLATVEVVPSGPGGEPPRTCLTARLTSSPPEADDGAVEDLDDLLAQCTEYLPAPDFYEQLRAYGYEVPRELAGVVRLWRRGGRAVARMRVPAPGHPAAWEIPLQPLLAVLPRSASDGAGHTYLPVGIDSVTVHGDTADLSSPVWSSAVLRPAAEGAAGPGDTVLRADVVIHADDGERVLAELRGVQLLQLTGMPRAVETVVDSADSADAPEGPSGVVAPESVTVPAPGPCADRETAVLTHAAALLGMTPERIDRRRPLRELGLDSITAVRLRQRIRNALGIDLPVGRLLGRESLGQLVASTKV